MTIRQPLVSCIIPVFNGERFIEEAIRSVLAQSYRPLEMIVVDDGSTDATAAIITRLGDSVRAVSQRNQGPAAARNHGLRQARGEFIGFLEVDDLWTPRRLERMLSLFAEHPSLDVVMGRTDWHRSVGDADGKYVSRGTSVSAGVGSALFRRSVFESIGVFDTSLFFSDDQDWFLRAREGGASIVVLPEITVIARQHGRNMTAGLGWKDVGILRVLKKSLDRRRLNQRPPASLPKLSDLTLGRQETCLRRS